MKLKGILISSLLDFKRYFSFVEFWDKHKMFKYALSPNRIYYWGQHEKNLYEIVERWLDMEDEIPNNSFPFEMEGDEIVKLNDADGNIKIKFNNKESIKAFQDMNGSKYPHRTIGILALYELIRKRIEPEEVSEAFKEIDYSLDVLQFPSGCNRTLPAVKAPITEINITLKKILITGSQSNQTTLRVGDDISGKEDYESEECAWATFIGNECIEILPNKGGDFNTNFTITLMNNSENQNITYIRIYNDFHETYEYVSNVKSFAVSQDSFYYIDSNGKIAGSYNLKSADYLIERGEKPVYVKCSDSAVLVLFANGKLRSTIQDFNQENVIKAYFDHGQIKTINP